MSVSGRITCLGPSTATLARAVTVTGGGGMLVVLVEVWGAGGDRASIEATLARRIADDFASATGSTTARLRAGFQAAHRLLCEMRAALPERVGLGAGASALVLVGRDAILGQTGPALAFRSAEDAVVRLPSTSPWLRRGVEMLRDDPVWPPLGMGDDVGVHWSNWTLAPGATAVFAPSTTTETLDRTTVASLLDPDPERARAAVRSVLGDGVPVVHVVLPRIDAPPTASEGTGARGARVDPRPGSARAPTGTSAEPTAGGLSGGVPAGGASARASGTPPPGPVTRPARPAVRLPRAFGPVASPEVDWRRITVRAVRLAARLLRAMLPERAAPDGYRVEWARLAAAAAVALPVAVVLLAVAVRARGGIAPGTEAGTPAEVAPSGTAAVSAPTDAPGTVRLAPAGAVALPGPVDDERHLVAVAGRPYVLDATADRVDRVVDGTARPVLAREHVVGADTVADLLDLFWLPPPSGADGRVVVLDAAGRLWALDGDAVQRVSRAEAPGWANVVRAAGYGGSLYVVDRGGNQIFRYAGDAAFPGFSAAGTGWLTTPEPLAGAVDVAIDGAIYVLFADGTLHRYVGGRLDEAFVTDPRAATTDARAVYTSPTAGRLLVADRAGGRIVVLGTDGGYEAELLQPTQGLSTDPVARAGRFAALSDAWWDEAGGVLYLVDGNLLLSAAYR